MKHFVSTGVLLGVLMTFMVAANAKQEGTPQNDTGQSAAGQKQATISGENDKRVITPDMNNLQRYEMQLYIKKRAAAMRNQLMQQAAKEKQQKALQP